VLHDARFLVVGSSMKKELSENSIDRPFGFSLSVSAAKAVVAASIAAKKFFPCAMKLGDHHSGSCRKNLFFSLT